ncbi:hypothetical protein BH20ACT2_BH20ACT2_01580 [soil metagenome]
MFGEAKDLDRSFRLACRVWSRCDIELGELEELIDGDLAAVWGQYRFSGQRRGDPVDYVAEATFVLEREGDQWLVRRYHESLVDPPATTG